MTRLSTNPGPNIVEDWSPDGQSIIVSSVYPTGNFNIYRLFIKGGERAAITNFDEGCAIFPLWSPDGQRMVFSYNSYSISQAYFIDIDGSNLVQIPNVYHAHDPWWSPDSNKIVLSASPGQLDEFELFILSLAENEVFQLTEADGLWKEAPTWSPNGEYVAFVSIRTFTERNIEIIRPDGTDRTLLTTFLRP